MTKEERRVYMKAYNAANKEKLAAKNRAYQDANKEKIAARKRDYYKTNKAKLRSSMKAYSETYRLSEGIGVYKAVFPSGVYIGSGQIQDRRKCHTTGTSHIAKSLNEKATSFEVVCTAETRELAYKLEEELIKNHGLANLLNKRSK